MNYFLFLIIIVTWLRRILRIYQTMLQQQSDLNAKIETLQTDNKKLEDDNAQLTKSVSDAQAKVADLTKQIQTTTTFTEARQQALQTANASGAAITVSPSSSNNNLGTITTLDGKTFPNCQLLKIKANCIAVKDSDGALRKFRTSSCRPRCRRNSAMIPARPQQRRRPRFNFRNNRKKLPPSPAGN